MCNEQVMVQVTTNKENGKNLINVATNHMGTIFKEISFRGMSVVSHTYSFPSQENFKDFRNEVFAEVGEIRILN